MLKRYTGCHFKRARNVFLTLLDSDFIILNTFDQLMNWQAMENMKRKSWWKIWKFKIVDKILYKKNKDVCITAINFCKKMVSKNSSWNFFRKIWIYVLHKFCIYYFSAEPEVNFSAKVPHLYFENNFCDNMPIHNICGIKGFFHISVMGRLLVVNLISDTVFSHYFNKESLPINL